MLKRLELQSMRADLETVLGSLQIHTRESDPIGWRQFQRRANKLRDKIREYEGTTVRTAHVGLFFGGKPVVGSYGIDASFSGRVLEQFQGIVSTRFASRVAPIAARGPVPNRSLSDLIIRDVARGSFGFILEENGGDQIVDSPLKDVMSEVVDLIYRIGAPDEETFEKTAEDIDGRLLPKLRDFFDNLDKSGAVLRIVDEDREFSLNRDDVQRAHERTENISITEEDPLNSRGTLYILPAGKRFELHSAANGIIVGSISAAGMEAVIDPTGNVKPELVGAEVDVSLLVKTVRSPNRDDKKTYRLDAIL